ncbi:MAG: serine/threonine-protein kinase [Sarcina sp.]
MEEILAYELQLYSDIKTIIDNKVYVVEHEVTKQFYIKKILSKDNLKVYSKLKNKQCKNRAQVIEYFLVDENLIVIEELVNGRTIENILQIEDLDEDEIVRIIIGICNGLSDIHNMKEPIIHRDIKPSNIMINSEGVVKLIDFDAARVSNELNNRDTRLIGTTGYASPEQFGFAQTDTRSDIYSIGVLLNYMILKKLPFEELADGDIGEIIKRATQIDRAHRYQTVEELKTALSMINVDKVMKKDKFKKGDEEENIFMGFDSMNEIESNILGNKVATIGKKKLVNAKDISLGTYKNIKSKRDEKKKIKEQKYREKEKNICDKTIRQVVGYRSGNILKCIMASFWYLTMFYGVGLFFTGYKLEDLGVAIYMIVLPEFMIGRGFGTNKYIPLVKSNSKIKNIIGKFIVWIILTLLMGFFMEPI